LSTFRRADDERGFHVLLLHGSIPGAPHWEGGSSLPLPLDRLSSLGADYLALGDLHRFRGPAELDGLPAAYPGSFAAVDFTETGVHGPLLVELARGGAPRIRRLPSGVREVGEPVRVDVSACADDRDVADAVFRLCAPDAYPVVTLEGEPGYPLDPDAVLAMLEERAGAAALRDESRFFDSRRLSEIARQSTIAGHVARLGLRRIEAAAGEAERKALEQGLRIALRVMEVA
jgi:DNA repair exonuclease SbcCD nuclease subunit